MSLGQLPKEFQKLGIRMPVAHKRKRLVISIEADAKVGKTRLLFTMAKPLLVIRFDPNSELQEEEAVEASESGVYILDTPIGDTIDQARDNALFSSRRQAIFDACKTEFFRSVAVDTGDHLWDLCQRGFLGAVGWGAAGGNQGNYSVPNGAMMRIFNAVKEQTFMSFAITQRVKDGRENVMNEKGKQASKLTGEVVATGWKHTKYEAQCVVRLEEEADYECQRAKCQTRTGCIAPAVHGADRYVCKITHSTFAGKGTVLRGAKINMPNIGMAVFPSTADTPEVWK